MTSSYVSDLIGEGAFSKVYRGSFQGVEIAIKRLMVPLDRQDRNYFAAEVSF
jgi:predicted Ser/Thr protein kinase